MVKMNPTRSAGDLIAWLLLAVFMIFSTPTPSIESSPGESAASGLRGTEFHTHVQSRTPDPTAAKPRPGAPLLVLLFALIVRMSRLPYRLSAHHRAHIASVHVLLRRRLLRPLQFTSTYVS
ncbi:hypothetical protein OMP38_33735 [Cohnella ginsengisoli]|uniref:Uncharacterized protein n=1 Tax=Cohnella ginsengisoli TaxID=425004 RepID=A0A9X4KMR2_9BACL|nr:hypothetical protein [Cohnella ginsengisoli]MDG0795239.1 hypothetical protein [Cohnella ginsengisoli]